MKNERLDMNLQLFAEPPADPTPATPPAANPPAATPPGQGASQPPVVDYEKIAQIVSGKQSVAEETVLKGYFKQQGLSQEEMTQAIAAYKQQQAAQQPDVGALQSQITTAQAEAQRAILEREATLSAIGLGIEAKTVPYVLKMADLGQVMGQDGKVNQEAMDAALKKVLEDVPALKPAQPQANGFQIGVSGNGGQTQTATDDELDKIFGIKKK